VTTSFDEEFLENWVLDVLEAWPIVQGNHIDFAERERGVFSPSFYESDVLTTNHMFIITTR
jgi:hypothetical protein